MAFLITGCFIILDMITGLIKAFKNRSYTSTVMREGLFHKCGSIICIVFSVLVDYAQNYLDLGVSVPVSVPVCVYICLMEAGSIIENVAEINPEIVPEKISKYFHKLTDKEDK